jgi:hypothetical protein
VRERTVFVPIRISTNGSGRHTLDTLWIGPPFREGFALSNLRDAIEWKPRPTPSTETMRDEVIMRIHG